MQEQTGEQIGINAFAFILVDYIRWMSEWQTAVLFAACNKPFKPPLMPQTLPTWVKNPANHQLASQPVVEKLLIIHDKLGGTTELIMKRAVQGWTPALDEYAYLEHLWLEYVTKIRRIERAFSFAASKIDPLTGLRSRQGMHEELQREFERLRRTGEPFCLAMCDIDHFKHVNDTHGHDVGDRVLGAVASFINQHIRAFDDAYRIGGEEFLICLKNSDLSTGYAVVDRLRIQIEHNPVRLYEGLQIPITCSFGLAQAQPDMDMDTLLILTDKALYESKSGGRNSVRVATTGQDESDKNDHSDHVASG